MAVDDAVLLVEGLRREGIDVIAEVAAAAPALAASDGMLGDDGETLLRALADADALVVSVSRATMSPTVVSVTRDDSMIGGGAAALELVIPRDDVSATLAAMADESALSIVPTTGAGS